jgi:NADH-quinone oxidoreductase subunit D
MKPFIYSTAIERGYGPGTPILDEPLEFPRGGPNGGTWAPQNDDGKYDGQVSMRQALAHSKNVPSVRLLRAVGVGYDVRTAAPHWAYDRVEFEVVTQKDGDNYARYLVRMAEMEQSMRIAEEALARMPVGPINVDFEGRPIDPAAYVDQGKQGKTEGLLLLPIRLSPNLEGQNKREYEQVNAADKRVVLPPKETTYGSIEGLMNHFMLIMEGYGIRPPKGEAYFATEGANGELGFYVVSDGGDRPYRVRCRPPCLPPVAALPRMIEGEMVADLIPTFGSVNMIGGELDR